MNSIYAPFTLGIHLTFCIIATVFYLYMFITKKRSQYFSLLLAFDLTLITQFVSSRPVIICLGIAEVILIVLAVSSSISYSRKDKKDALKTQNKPKDNQKINVIDDAFKKQDM